MGLKLIYNYYQDAAHGWVAVKRSLLTVLGIADKVSAYSYEKGQTVYLEEDSDAPLFIRAMEARGNKIVLEAKHCERSPIRSYASYKA